MSNEDIRPQGAEGISTSANIQQTQQLGNPLPLPRLQSLLRVAECAIDLHRHAVARQGAYYAFRDACYAYRCDRHVSAPERDSPQWDAMIEAVSTEYLFLQNRKRDERNAERRLTTAVRAHLNGAAQ